MGRDTVRYSESFKLQVIKDFEEGRFKSICQLNRHYGIKGGSTVSSWLRQYGKSQLLGRRIVVQKPKEIDEKKELKKRIKELEKALAATQVKAVLSESYYEIVCEENGIEDSEAYKKKLDSKL